MKKKGKINQVDAESVSNEPARENSESLGFEPRRTRIRLLSKQSCQPMSYRYSSAQWWELSLCSASLPSSKTRANSRTHLRELEL